MTPAEIEAYEARLIIEDVLEACDQVEEFWAGFGPVMAWENHPVLLARRIRSLIEDGDQ